MLKFLLDFQLRWYFVALVGFLTVFLADIVWVLYIRWSSQGRALRAGAVSSILVVNGWIGLLVFIGNPWVAFTSEMFGAFFGTIVAIRIDRTIENRRLAAATLSCGCPPKVKLWRD